MDDVATAEARALLNGLILAGQVGCNRIMVESDCMEVVDIMKHGGNSIGPAATIYEECSFLAHNFDHVIINHCPREANKAADLLARQLVDPQNIGWDVDPPEFLVHVLADDVLLLHKTLSGMWII